MYFKQIFFGLNNDQVQYIMGFHGSGKHFAIVADLRRHSVVFEEADQGEIVVLVQAVSDFAAVLPVTGGKFLDRSAVGDIALSISAHEQLCPCLPCFF